MPNYAGLKALLETGPYQGQTVAQQAALLLTSQSVACDVSIAAVEGYLLINGIRTAINNFIASPPAGASTAVIDAAQSLVALLDSPRLNVIEMASDPTVAQAVTAMLGAMVAASLMTSAQEATLLSLATTSVTPASQLGFGANADLTQEIPAALIWSP